MPRLQGTWKNLKNSGHGRPINGVQDLSDAEQEAFSKLETESQRDLFRILENFARQATITKQPDFPFPYTACRESSRRNVSTRQ